MMSKQMSGVPTFGHRKNNVTKMLKEDFKKEAVEFHIIVWRRKFYSLSETSLGKNKKILNFLSVMHKNSF